MHKAYTLLIFSTVHTADGRRRLLYFLGGRADVALVDLCGESQRVERFPKVLLPRGNVDEHERLGVAAQRALEEVGQLGVAVGDVRVLDWK